MALYLLFLCELYDFFSIFVQAMLIWIDVYILCVIVIRIGVMEAIIGVMKAIRIGVMKTIIGVMKTIFIGVMNVINGVMKAIFIGNTKAMFFGIMN